MLRSIAALIMVLIITGQAVAGGIICGIDVLSSGLNNTDEMACPMQNQGDCEEMACCAQGKSPTGSVGATACCAEFCGESTGGAQLNLTPQTLSVARAVVSYRAGEFGFFRPDTDLAFSVFLRSAENNLLSPDPRGLFRINSFSLIWPGRSVSCCRSGGLLGQLRPARGRIL